MEWNIDWIRNELFPFSLGSSMTLFTSWSNVSNSLYSILHVIWWPDLSSNRQIEPTFSPGLRTIPLFYSIIHFIPKLAKSSCWVTVTPNNAANP